MSLPDDPYQGGNTWFNGKHVGHMSLWDRAIRKLNEGGRIPFIAVDVSRGIMRYSCLVVEVDEDGDPVEEFDIVEMCQVLYSMNNGFYDKDMFGDDGPPRS